MALTAPIFAKLTDVEGHYVEISHTEFHQSVKECRKKGQTFPKFDFYETHATFG
jgi:hypothetical protein